MAEKINENFEDVCNQSIEALSAEPAENTTETFSGSAETTITETMTAAEKQRETNSAEMETKCTTTKKRNVFARLGAWIRKQFFALKSAVQERGNELQNAKKKRIAAAIGVAALIVFLVLFYILVGMAIVNLLEDPQGFKTWIDGFGTSSIFIFIGLRVIMTVLRVIPGGPLQVAGGYAFGTWWGAVWCMAGSLIGTLIIFLLGKKYGTKLVGLFVSPEKMRSAAMLKDKKKRNVFLFLMNFLPGTPKDIFTWMAAISNDGAFSSILVILLARIPSVVASTWCGHELMQENYVVSAVVFGVLLVLGVVCSYAYKKLSARHEARAKAQENTGKEEK